MSYSLDITIPGLPKTTNSGARRHWKRQFAHALAWHRHVHFAVPINKRPSVPLERAKLTLTRVSSQEPDYDGLVSSFKVVIDGLVELGILANDKMSNIGIPEYKWERGPIRKGHIRIQVQAQSIDETPRTG